MRLGDDLRVLWVQLELVLERRAAVLDGVGVQLVLERDLGEGVVRVRQALFDVPDLG